MAIEEESIQQLKNRLDIVDVVGRYVELKKDGAGYKANCPFHDEKTASFKVSPSKQIYHCFGCGAGGDSIKFMMEYEKLSYPEAIEKLAEEYNFPLKYTDNYHQKSKIDNTILEELSHFFRRELQSYPPALEYLKSRGVYDSSIEKFELGYAPRSEKTMQFLKNKGMSEKEGLELGIVARDESSGRTYARFTNRVIFPIFNPSGKIVGFGGRIIVARDDIGKYINSPQSRIFDKSTLLYGYHKAKNTIMKKGRIIVVEGNLDVVMLHQAGWTNAVATLGTAFTEKIIPLLKRGNPEVILAYDGDRAGINAAFKAAMMLSLKGFRGGVVIFKGGKDPADMVKADETDTLKKLFNHATDFISFCLAQIVAKYNLAQPLQKEQARNEAVAYLTKLSPLIQDEYRPYLATLLHIDPRHIRLSSDNSPQVPQNTPPSAQNFSQKEDIAELSVIKTLLNNPKMIDRLLDILSSEVFTMHKEAFERLIGNEIDHPILRGIQIREDLISYDDETLLAQVRFLLRRYYEKELAKIRFRKDLTIEKKSFIIRKIREIILRLKKGETVPYESFSTF